MLKKFCLLLLVFYFLSCHTVSSSTVDIEKPLPDGTMELWEFEKTIIEARIIGWSLIALSIIALSIGLGTRIKRKIFWIPIVIMFLVGVFLVLASFVVFLG